MSKVNYSIRIHKRARKGLSKLPANRQQQARSFINNHLRLTPKQHIPAKTKRLSANEKVFISTIFLMVTEFGGVLMINYR